MGAPSVDQRPLFLTIQKLRPSRLLQASIEWPILQPRIDKRDTGSLKIRHIPRHDRHPMDQRSRSDHGIAM